ncbi:MAG TPA: bifunctional serine/threonine-protein kinase/formylglycine-generating enzyme family protein [Xanthomonadales bacterium]|nr:bifunctional serine/threonine-protein kinase/formylglycine-generating enzyme family protein [Xanthomonadales bacterium]
MTDILLDPPVALPQIPGYRIVRRLGEGGMADVYLAVQLSLQRQIAIKVLSFDKAMSQDLAERFEREARTIARLDHPNIVGIHEVGRAGDALYYTMPFLPNGDLSQRDLRDEPRRVVEVLRSVCEALKYAHAHGVVHRDVKPANILFDKTERVLLADFGIAISRDFESRVTTQDKMVGSTGYMSPEQARRQDLDGRADIYSLGVVCYELLTGELPFHGADALSVAIAHMQDPIPRLPPTRRAWQPLIDKALAKSPEHRFQNAGEMLVALGEIEQSIASSGEPRHGGSLAVGALFRDTRARIAFGVAALALAAIWLGANLYERRASLLPARPAPASGASPAAEREAPLPIADAAELDRALAEGYALLREGKLYEPEGGSAASRFLGVLATDPNSAEARAGLDAVIAAAQKRALAAIAAGRDAEASALHERTYALAQNSMIPDYAAYGAFERAFAEAVIASIDDGIARGDRELATRMRESFAIAARNAPKVTERLELLAKGLAPGARIQDPGGPVLAYMPERHGGSPLPAYAIAVNEVTKGEYAAFARATGRAAAPCGGGLFKKIDWRNPGFAQRNDEPVVCVSSADAQAYARWLSQRTGSTYRLPTRAEWMLAARDAAPRSGICGRANVLDASTGRGIVARYDCSDGFEHTAPVGRYAATGLGFHDLVGNVREWSSECTRREGRSCRERAVLGSSYRDGSRRPLLGVEGLPADQGAIHVGIRLVREFER